MVKSRRSKKAGLFFDCGLIAASVAAVLFYALCATPSLGWRDGPELVVTADFIDIAHPSGFPAYNLLAKISTWLPLGSLGFRVTLVSALAGGLSILILGLLLKKLHRLGDSNETQNGVGSADLAWLWAPLPFLALQQGFWAASIEVEVYTLNLLMLISLFYCAASWFDGGGARWLYAGGLLYGLACSNHAAMALYLPVLLLLTFLGQPQGPNALAGPNHDPGRRVLILAGLFLVGLSVYLLLLIRSNLLTLPFNLGHANTLENFWDHVSDAKDRDVQGKGLIDAARFFTNLRFHFNNLTSSLFWLGLPLSLWGLNHLWRRYQAFTLAIVTLVIINLGFFYYWIDGVSAFLPTILVFILLVALGLGRLGRLLERLGFPRLASLALAAIIAATAVFHLGPARFSERDSEAGFMSVEMFWPDLSSRPPESIFLQTGNWFSGVALQSIYSARPDVSLLHWPSIVLRKPVAPIIPERFPMASFPLGADGHPMSHYDPAFYSLFLEANTTAGKPVYIQYSENSRLLSPYLRPDPTSLFLARVYPDDNMERLSFQKGDIDRLAEKLLKLFDSLGPESDPPLARKAPAYLYYIMRPVAALAAENSRPDLAIRLMEAFFARFTGADGLLMAPWDAVLDAQGYLTLTLFNLKRYPEALKSAEKLIEMDPRSAYPYYLLASSQYALGLRDEAIKTMSVCVEVDKYDPNVAIRYAKLLAKHRSINAARSFLDERARYMRKGGMSYSAAALDEESACLGLPPENELLPGSLAARAAEMAAQNSRAAGAPSDAAPQASKPASDASVISPNASDSSPSASESAPGASKDSQ